MPSPVASRWSACSFCGLMRCRVKVVEGGTHVSAERTAPATSSGGQRLPDRVAGELWFRFLSGPDIAALSLSNAEVVAAVEDAGRAHGHGRVVVEPRVHLVPDNDGAGHFNVLLGHLSAPGAPASGVSGVKVVGDFVANYAAGLPSELGLLTLYDPGTGVPLAIMDATMITACRTGAIPPVAAP